MLTFVFHLIVESQIVKLSVFKGQDMISEKEVCTVMKRNVSSSQGNIQSSIVGVMYFALVGCLNSSVGLYSDIWNLIITHNTLLSDNNLHS